MELMQIRKPISGKKAYTHHASPLKGFTPARISLGRTGTSMPLKEYFAFKLAHANARDAVYSTLDLKSICRKLRLLKWQFQVVSSKAACRQEYLKCSHLGRQLSKESRKQFKSTATIGFDIAFVLADGLSATAINDNAIPLLKLLLSKFIKAGYSIAPIIIAEQARVAIADEVGVLLRAKLTIILIGERPGLSSPNSLGAYLTYAPKKNLTDESRNCVSNIRPEGLDYVTASEKIFYLVQQSLKRQLSGVGLKEEVALLNF